MNCSEMRLEPQQISFELIFNNLGNKNQTEQIVCYNKFTQNIYVQEEPKRVGYDLMNFVNNFYQIQNAFIEFIHYIKNLENFKFEDLNIYKNKLVTNLSSIIPETYTFISLTLDTFLYNIKYDYDKMNFLTTLENLKKKNKEYSEVIDTYIFEFEKYMQNNQNIEHYDNEDLCINTSIYGNYSNLNRTYQQMFVAFLSKYKDLLENLYLYITKTFSSKENKNINAKRFRGIPLNIYANDNENNTDNQFAICLPYSESFYDIYNSNKEPKPVTIKYFIRHFSDFVFISLYNILQSKVAISRCKYCEKYFITCLDNKEHFCPVLDNVGNFSFKRVLIETDDLERTDKKIKIISKCEKLYKPKERGRQEEFENKELTALLRKHRKRLNREKKTDRGIEEQKILLGIDKEIERKHNLLKELYRTDTRKIEDELFNFASSIIKSFEENCNNKKYGNKNALHNKS